MKMIDVENPKDEINNIFYLEEKEIAEEEVDKIDS
jgi:hypothetical protein